LGHDGIIRQVTGNRQQAGERSGDVAKFLFDHGFEHGQVSDDRPPDPVDLEVQISVCQDIPEVANATPRHIRMPRLEANREVTGGIGEYFQTSQYGVLPQYILDK
jgi:hypothetical protein